MLTMPEFAFLALCRLARPLASPGPRCSSVDAGVPLMRKEPSAAPVSTPSNRPSTQRMPSTRSRAATKCISEVPGLEKQTSTPPATSVRTRLSAPFIVPLPFAVLVAKKRSTIVRGISQRGVGHCCTTRQGRGFLTAAFEIASLAPAWLANLRLIWPVLTDPISCDFLARMKNDPDVGSADCGGGVFGRHRPFAGARRRHARYHGRRPEFLWSR